MEWARLPLTRYYKDTPVRIQLGGDRCWIDPRHRGELISSSGKFICRTCQVTWYGGREVLPL